MLDMKYPSRGLVRIGLVVPVSNTCLEPGMARLARQLAAAYLAGTDQSGRRGNF